MVRAIRLSIEAVDGRLEEAASTLGAPAWFVFGSITLPLALPGILAGLILGFARAIGEFGATITFVANIPGETQTLASAIWSSTQDPAGEPATWRLTGVAIAIAVAALLASEVLAAANRPAGRRRMIEIEVRHRLGAFAIAADIRASGRLLAICGASGAGKTTLLNMIAGLLRPDEGRVAVDGVVFLDTATGARHAAAPAPRRLCLPGAAAVSASERRGNLRYGARFAPDERPSVGFDEVVALLGIAPLLARQPARLSGGEKQRVAIGRALLISPRALLLDEPLTAIDDARRRDILGLIEQLRDAFAIPIIFVSHRAGEVERLASDIAVLSRGRLVEMRKGAARHRPIEKSDPSPETDAS